MKQGIHPNYVPAKAVCNCGNEFTTRSTKRNILVEICSACHPFYTGAVRMIDTEGRIDKFRKKYAKKA